MINQPGETGVIWASNLTQVTPGMRADTLRTLLTKGTHPTRGDLWVMPAPIYQRLSPVDLNAIIAYLRQLKPAGQPSPPPVLGPKARTGSKPLTPSATLVAAARASMPVDLGQRHAKGRYIAMTACAVCHGFDLGGIDGMGPDLAVAAAYDRQQFETLMTSGVGVGGRKIAWLMATAAKENAARLTITERDALYSYLIARANQP